ncbi:DUF397 domain-containing protein [Streptomycetaceae bacterium NBC_01309]
MTNTPAAGDWFKSSYSNNQGGNCVEGARVGVRAMAVRDSKDAARGMLVVGAASWSSLASALKATS